MDPFAKEAWASNRASQHQSEFMSAGGQSPLVPHLMADVLEGLNSMEASITRSALVADGLYGRLFGYSPQKCEAQDPEPVPSCQADEIKQRLSSLGVRAGALESLLDRLSARL